MSKVSTNPALGRVTHIAVWILQILLALAFIAAGGAKLAGAQMMVQSFEQIGLGQGFRYVTAVVEIVGAVALLTPRVTFFGALWLAATMTGATLAHLLRLHTSPAPALVLLVLCLTIAWLRRGQLGQLTSLLRKPTKDEL